MAASAPLPRRASSPSSEPGHRAQHRGLWRDLSIRRKGLVVVAIPVSVAIALAVALNAVGLRAQAEGRRGGERTETVLQLGRLDTSIQQLSEHFLMKAAGLPHDLADENAAVRQAQLALGELGQIATDDDGDAANLQSLELSVPRMIDLVRRVSARPSSEGTAIRAEFDRSRREAVARIRAWEINEQAELHDQLAAVAGTAAGARTLGWIAALGALLGGVLAIRAFGNGIARRIAQVQGNALSLSTGGTMRPLSHAHDEIGRLDQAVLESGAVLTDRQAALAGAQRKLARIIEMTPATIFTLDPDTQLVRYTSASGDWQLGHDPESFKLPGFFESVVHPDDLEAARAETQRALEEGHSTQQYRMRAADGTYRSLVTELTLVRDAAGRPLEIAGAMLDVTDQVEAQERLRSSQTMLAEAELATERAGAEANDAGRRYRTLFSQSSAGMYMGTLDGHPLEMNDGLAHILGYRDAPQFLNEVADMRAVWASQDRRDLFVATAVAAGEVAACEAQWYRRDGSKVWLMISTKLTELADGQPVSLGVVIDVDAQKQAERIAQANQERFSALFEEALDGVLLCDDTGRFLDANPATCRILGLGRDELIGHSMDDLLAPEMIELAAAAQTEFLRVGHAVGEFPLVPRDGTPIVVEYSSKANITPGVHLSIIRDVTERRAEHARVVRSETLLAEAQQMAHFGSFQCDSETGTLQWSDEMFRMMGLEPGAVEPTPGLAVEFIHPDDRERVGELSERAFATGETVTYEHRIIRADGETRHLECTLVAKAGPDGIRRRMAGTEVDVTERIRGEEALRAAFEREREASKHLRESAEIRDAFLTAVSHELRTPLTAVLGFAATLEQSATLAEDDRPLVEPIHRNALKLNRLLSDLLDLDRLRRGVAVLDRADVDLAELTREVVDGCDFLGGRTVILQAEPVHACVDPAKVERIIENLVANAVKYSPSEGRIWVKVERDVTGSPVLIVEDEGRGIPADVRSTLFEPFSQGSNAVKHSPGVGIGLSLVRFFADLHGGHAWVEDREGGGSSFRVSLPGAVVPALEPEGVQVDRVRTERVGASA
jgi:PAS domain S-box-containing protein